MYNLKKITQVTLLLALSSTFLLQACNGHSGNAPKSISFQGYVVHGINTYNGKPIVDYSGVSPLVPYLTASPAVNEVGVYQEGLDYSGTISSETDRNTPVATTRSFFDYFNPEGSIELDTINIPLGEIGSNFLGPDFTSLDKRVTPVSFSESGSEPSLFRKKGFVINPTVRDWEKMSGKMSVKEGENDLYTVEITFRGAFPNAIYTLWDVGTLNPLTTKESGYAIPLGGLPNIVVTDENGCGFAKLELKYDLSRPCEAGARSCSSYVSAFFNWDNSAYGASAAATWAKAPTGVYGGNQMAWPTSGTTLIEPQNYFHQKSHGCKSGNHSSGKKATL